MIWLIGLVFNMNYKCILKLNCYGWSFDEVEFELVINLKCIVLVKKYFDKLNLVREMKFYMIIFVGY